MTFKQGTIFSGNELDSRVCLRARRVFVISTTPASNGLRLKLANALFYLFIVFSLKEMRENCKLN